MKNLKTCMYVLCLGVSIFGFSSYGAEPESLKPKSENLTSDLVEVLDRENYSDALKILQELNSPETSNALIYFLNPQLLVLIANMPNSSASEVLKEYFQYADKRLQEMVQGEETNFCKGCVPKIPSNFLAFLLDKGKFSLLDKLNKLWPNIFEAQNFENLELIKLIPQIPDEYLILREKLRVILIDKNPSAEKPVKILGDSVIGMKDAGKRREKIQEVVNSSNFLQIISSVLYKFNPIAWWYGSNKAQGEVVDEKNIVDTPEGVGTGEKDGVHNDKENNQIPEEESTIDCEVVIENADDEDSDSQTEEELFIKKKSNEKK